MPTLTLTPAQQKLAVHLLKMASEEYGNHGCNDLDLVKEVKLTRGENYEIQEQMYAWCPDGFSEPNRMFTITSDSGAFDFIRHLIEEAK